MMAPDTLTEAPATHDGSEDSFSRHLPCRYGKYFAKRIFARPWRTAHAGHPASLRARVALRALWWC